MPVLLSMRSATTLVLPPLRLFLKFPTATSPFWPPRCCTSVTIRCWTPVSQWLLRLPVGTTPTSLPWTTLNASLETTGAISTLANIWTLLICSITPSTPSWATILTLLCTNLSTSPTPIPLSSATSSTETKCTLPKWALWPRTKCLFTLKTYLCCYSAQPGWGLQSQKPLFQRSPPRQVRLRCRW